MRAQMLQPEDVAAACLFAVSLPPRAYVPELTILPDGPAGARPDHLANEQSTAAGWQSERADDE